MIESAIAFGASSGLVGTLCMPSGSDAPCRGLGLILFNAGVIHRIGPHRLNVRIARVLAKRGVPSLRFDLAGVGDSLRPSGRHPFEAQAVIDLRSAMDALASAGRLSEFALFGFCSGAYHGYATALADERVVGLLLYDAYIYGTFKSHVNRIVMRLRRHGWLRAVGGWAVRGLVQSAQRLLRAVLRRKTDQPVASVWYVTDLPSKVDFAAGLRALLERGVGVGLIYSGADRESYNYDRQFYAAFAGLGINDRVVAEFLPDVDHVATSTRSQAELVRRIESWVHRLRALPTADAP